MFFLQINYFLINTDKDTVYAEGVVHLDAFLIAP